MRLWLWSLMIPDDETLDRFCAPYSQLQISFPSSLSGTHMRTVAALFATVPTATQFSAFIDLTRFRKQVLQHSFRAAPVPRAVCSCRNPGSGLKCLCVSSLSSMRRSGARCVSFGQRKRHCRNKSREMCANLQGFCERIALLPVLEAKLARSYCVPSMHDNLKPAEVVTRICTAIRRS